MKKGRTHIRAIDAAVLILIPALGFLAFGPVLDAPFIFDDIHTIRDNHHLRNHLSPVYFFAHPESASRMPNTMIRPLLSCLHPSTPSFGWNGFR